MATPHLNLTVVKASQKTFHTPPTPKLNAALKYYREEIAAIRKLDHDGRSLLRAPLKGLLARAALIFAPSAETHSLLQEWKRRGKDLREYRDIVGTIENDKTACDHNLSELSEEFRRGASINAVRETYVGMTRGIKEMERAMRVPTTAVYAKQLTRR